MTALTSAICASDDMVRQVIATAVRHADIEVVSETTLADDLVSTAVLVEPDLIVVDNDLPWRSGLSCLAELYEALPTSAILLVANDRSVRDHAMELGAFGVVYKQEFTEIDGAIGRARAWLSDPELRKPGERRTGRDRRVHQDWNKVTTERRGGGDRRDQPGSGADDTPTPAG